MENKIPKISIIMPVYNAEKFLKDSIESVLNQNEENIELIIINDGSNDNSKIIINEYKLKDNRIKFIEQKNMGVSTSRNVGIKISNGEYIAFIDADDLWLNNKLERQLIEFEKDKNLKICGAWAYLIDEYGEFLINKTTNNIKVFSYPPLTDNEIKWKSIYKYPFVTSSLLIKKNILDYNNLFNTKMTHAEDYDFITKYIYKNKCKNINEYLIRYRIHNKNSNSNKIKTIKHKLLAMKIRTINIFRFLISIFCVIIWIYEKNNK